MQTKTYLAPTKLEALLKIREEHGADAVILSERTVQKGKLFSKKPMVEIVVGIKGTESEPNAEPRPAPKAEPKGIDEYDPTQTRLRKLEREMQEIRALVQTMHAYIANGAVPAPTTDGETELPMIAATLDEHPLLRPLMAAGVEQEVAQELLRRVPRLPHNAAVDALRRTLTARIPIGGALPRESRHRQVAVLVGPTGVGKTTTIAKLAAIHALDYNRKVALLSLDTYRIGAIQQLRTYAELMNLPLLTSPPTPRKCQDALEQFAGYDLVLIDTIGRGQRDEEHLQEMRQALLPVKGVVYLTLSATADSATLLDAAQRFRLFEPDAVILTKLDEAARMGNCVNLALRGSLPFAYFTTGQRVPEDITLADAHDARLRHPAHHNRMLHGTQTP
jgi:flagellar biosynthesis protein FlhF